MHRKQVNRSLHDGRFLAEQPQLFTCVQHVVQFEHFINDLSSYQQKLRSKRERLSENSQPNPRYILSEMLH